MYKVKHGANGSVKKYKASVLDVITVSIVEREQVARKSDSLGTTKSLNWYDMTMLDAKY